jgi:hypothetical protein
VYTIAKNTPADYPDLLAAVDAGITQRELALRYDCTPSLVARHVARAKRARELGDCRDEADLAPTAVPHAGSMREILEARIRDPSTSARDLASLTNVLVKLDEPPPPPPGVEVPWWEGATSAVIWFYSVPEGGGPPPDPATLNLDDAFIVHKLGERQTLLVFPYPAGVEDDPGPEETPTEEPTDD